MASTFAWLRRIALVAVSVQCSIAESGLESDAGTPNDVAIDAGPADDAAMDVATSGDAQGDVAPDVPSGPCTLSKPFGPPQNLGMGVNSSENDTTPSLTPDELTIFFARGTGSSDSALYYTTRPTFVSPFGPATEITTISNGSTIDYTPFVVGTFSALYFASIRGGNSNAHLYKATGDGVHPFAWTGITQLGISMDDNVYDRGPAWCGASNELWFESTRGVSSFNLFVSTNGTMTPVSVPGVDDTNDEISPTLSADGLTLFYGEASKTSGPYTMMTTTRASLSTTTFDAGPAVTELDTPGPDNLPGWLSGDGCRMYFASDRTGGSGGLDIWVATRPL